MEGRKDNNKPLNEIRIGFRSRVRNIVNYATILLNENKFRSLNLSAIGGAIGSLVNAVEVLKINNPGLYQVNKIGTVSYQTVDQQGQVQNQRLYPKLEVVLMKVERDSKTNFQKRKELNFWPFQRKELPELKEKRDPEVVSEEEVPLEEDPEEDSEAKEELPEVASEVASEAKEELPEAEEENSEAPELTEEEEDIKIFLNKLIK